MARYLVGAVGEIPPGQRKIAEVGGRSIGVFNLGGEFFALLNRCPHQAGPLCEGHCIGLVLSERPGEYRFLREGEILRCPWHGWEFDIRTGQSWFDPARTRVRRYDIFVEPPSATPSGELPGLVRGPYVAETYPVTVDENRVMVEIPGAVRATARSGMDSGPSQR